MRVFLDRLYLFSGYLAGAFMLAIFVLMMLLSAGRPIGLNIPAADDFVSWCMAAMAFLGLAIFSADHVLYPTYAVAEGAGAALADQRVAGALMWTGGMFLIVPALAFVLFDWMRADEREGRRVDALLVREGTRAGAAGGSGP